MTESRSSRTPANLARGLARSGIRAALATSLGGAPYASLVLLAVDLDASPLLLLSGLAQHSRNIAFDPRVSLLLDETVRALCNAGQQQAPCEIAAAKFVSVVRPGESLRIEHERCADGWIRFVIRAPDRLVASGRLTWEIVRDTDREV